MEYVIYLDSFFIINFTMDLIIIVICKRLAGRKSCMVRSVAAAAFGGIYACAYIIFPHGKYSVLSMLLSYFAAVSVMVLIAFGYKNGKRFIENVLVLYIINFLSGGISNFLYFRAGIKNMPLILLFTAFTGIFASKAAVKKRDVSQVCYEVTVVNGGRQIDVPALLDTGNSLKEPYFGRPVSILEGDEAIKLIEGDDIHTQKGYMKIPFFSLGKEDGLIDGFEVEKILINMPARVICRERAVIGVYKGKLSSDRSYSMILNPEMLKEI